jgi:large subunit ribosomal protein L29
MKPKELRAKSVDDLNKELIALRRAQFGLRMQKATQQLAKNSEIPRLKRDIARIHTVLTEKKRSQP